MANRRITYKQFRFHDNNPYQEAADFATSLGDRFVTITGHGDTKWNCQPFISPEKNFFGRVVVWYYKELKQKDKENEN